MGCGDREIVSASTQGVGFGQGSRRRVPARTRRAPCPPLPGGTRGGCLQTVLQAGDLVAGGVHGAQPLQGPGRKAGQLVSFDLAEKAYSSAVPSVIWVTPTLLPRLTAVTRCRAAAQALTTPTQ